MSMVIYVNGKKQEVEDGMNISALLDSRKIRPEVVVVELNDNIVDKDKYSQTALGPGDKLEFVFYMGGGGLMIKI